MPEHTELREYRGADGRAPVTGTEWEYEEALQKAREGGAPDLLVFRNQQPALIETRDARLREEQLRQLAALEAFWSRHFANQGMFLGAYTDFADDVQFAKALEMQLRKLIEKRIASRSQVEPSRSSVWIHAPFRGLEAYEFVHAPIYFGQDVAIARAMLQLTYGAARGSHFLLIVGASGAGKSSLVSAGILPRLFVPRRVTETAFLRRVVFRPSEAEAGEDIFDAFARRLVARGGDREGLPELLAGDISIADLAAHLRGASATPELPFQQVLGVLAAEARKHGHMLAYEKPKLVLVVDQLEELFTIERISPADRVRFVELVAALANSGLVWVVATVRADFWQRALELPTLAGLADGSGRLDLLAPSPAQLSQMIRRPAEAAGIAFEVQDATGLPLNEVIAEEVAREPGALPLLSYLLDQLYRTDIRDSGGRRLTYATFEALGRLEGAIAARAEAVLARCSPPDRDALGALLFALVQMGVGEGDAERPIARRTPLSTFPEGSAERRLAEAFLDPDARLLISDAGRDGLPTVRVAHEALITHWARARDFVIANAEALKVRRRIEERYALWRRIRNDAGSEAQKPRRGISRWLGAPQPEAGLLTDIDLNDGLRLTQHHRTHVDPEIADFIDRSAAQERRQRTRAFRLFAGGAAAAAALVVITSIAGVFAAEQAHETAAARVFQEADWAADRLRKNDLNGAEAIVLDALAGRIDMRAPGAQRATSVLEEYLAKDLQHVVLRGHQKLVGWADVSRDGRRVVTASYDKTAVIWDAVTGQPLVTLRGHDGPVLCAVFAPDGKHVATASSDGTARVWDAETGAEAPIVLRHAGAVLSVSYSADGRKLVTASSDKTARVWDAATGALLATMTGHTDTLASAAFSQDGARVVTASWDKTARIWDASGHQLGELKGHTLALSGAAFSPDGRFVVTSSDDRTARVWDVSKSAEVLRLIGHTDTVSSAEYSPNGLLIVTASHDDTGRVWNASTGAPVAVLAGHEKGLEHAAFLADSRHVVTASDDATARIWDTFPSREIGAFAASDEVIEDLAYSPDGRLIVTAADDKLAHVWSATTHVQTAVLKGHRDNVMWASFSQDGRFIVTASSDKTARIWDAASGEQLLELVGHAGVVTSASFSPDGRRVLTTSDDGTARLWDAKSGRQIGELKDPGKTVFEGVYSPDGRYIATVSGHLVTVWDAVTGARLNVLKCHALGVLSVAFSHDSHRIVTASRDRTARVWDASTGAPLLKLVYPEDELNAAAYAPDDTYIVTGSRDGTARVWDAATGLQVAALLGNGEAINAVAYSRGGEIATGSISGLVTIWDGKTFLPPAVQVSWARAASAEPPLLNGERAALGLPERGAPRWLPMLAGFGVSAAGAATIGNDAVRDEQEAHQAKSVGARDDLLLSAFSDYAVLVKRADDAGRNDADVKTWRSRRATLARLLTSDGRGLAVAQAFDRVSGM